MLIKLESTYDNDVRTIGSVNCFTALTTLSTHLTTSSSHWQKAKLFEVACFGRARTLGLDKICTERMRQRRKETGAANPF